MFQALFCILKRWILVSIEKKMNDEFLFSQIDISKLELLSVSLLSFINFVFTLEKLENIKIKI